ncbi:MAG: hypothetical protein K6A76_04965 [Oribacterium sp.]|nr:hypothetical protein [Oribacterium sp.]
MLDLYNALNDSDYKDVSELELFTIEDVIYIKMKNDVAFILDSYLSLWEQQSTDNPNMPVRGLMYFGKLYSKYIKSRKLNIYGTKQIMLPTPRYVVLYNGAKDAAPIKTLRLSDSFIYPDKSGDFEWTATVYNLSLRTPDGYKEASYESQKLFETQSTFADSRDKDHMIQGEMQILNLRNKCRVLDEYMILVERIRNYIAETNDISKAVDTAVVSCIKDGILAEFLNAHRSEVLDVCITEFDEKTFIEGIKEEGREEGRKEGMKKKEKDLVSKMLSNGKTPSSISDFCDIPLDYVLEVQKEMGLASPSDK